MKKNVTLSGLKKKQQVIFMQEHKKYFRSDNLTMFVERINRRLQSYATAEENDYTSLMLSVTKLNNNELKYIEESLIDSGFRVRIHRYGQTFLKGGKRADIKRMYIGWTKDTLLTNE